jgi:hypothetical protein
MLYYNVFPRSLELVGLLVIHAWYLVMSSLDTKIMGLVANINECSSASWLFKNEGPMLLLAYNDYICEN